MEDDFLDLEILDEDITPLNEQDEEPPTPDEVIEEPTPPATEVNDPDENSTRNKTEVTDLAEGDEGDEIELNDEEGNIYGLLSAALKEQDFFKDTDITNVNDIESLSEAFRSEVKNNELSGLNDQQKRVLEAFRNGVPESEIINNESDFERLNNITDEQLSDESFAKTLIIGDLLEKGISQDRAEKMFDMYVDTGDMESEARISLDNKKNSVKAEYDAKMQQIQDSRDASIKRANDLHTNISKNIADTEEFMGDYKVTDTLKDKAQKNMNSVVGYTDDGQPYNALMKARMDDPADFESKMYLLFTITDGFSNLGAFSRKAESKATKDLEMKLRNSGTASISKPSFQSGPKATTGEIVDV